MKYNYKYTTDVVSSDQMWIFRPFVERTMIPKEQVREAIEEATRDKGAGDNNWLVKKELIKELGLEE